MSVGMAPAAVALISTVTTMAICGRARWIGQRAKLMVSPDTRRRHQQDTPQVGGLAILIPVFVISLIESGLEHVAPHTYSIVAGSALMLMVGVLDDRFNVPTAWRFALSALVVCVVLYIEPIFVLHDLRVLGWGTQVSLSLGGIAVPVTAFLLVGFLNSANMADGMDGQFLGSVLIWSLLIIEHQDSPGALPFVALAASTMAALAFNLRHLLFAGNGGAYGASLFVAFGAIQAYFDPAGTLYVENLVFWFWLPALDCARLIASRILSGHSPFRGDRNHIHHVLLEIGSWRFALLVYLGLLAAPGVAAEVNVYAGGAILGICAAIYAAILVRHARLREAIPTSSFRCGL
jgi:UDP-GlcNAc:undecaprenyl-phosphate/decaprenyl-phosphate GlcNAc-1-phosphate transferase